MKKNNISTSDDVKQKSRKKSVVSCETLTSQKIPLLKEGDFIISKDNEFEKLEGIIGYKVLEANLRPTGETEYFIVQVVSIRDADIKRYCNSKKIHILKTVSNYGEQI